MKKIISVFLIVLLLMSCLCLNNFAAGNDGTADASSREAQDLFVTVEPDVGEVKFSEAYAQPGKPIKASVVGMEGEVLLFKWFLDNEQINEFSDTYTPTEGDYEKMLTVKVYNTDCELVGLKSMFISPLPVVYIEVDDRQPIVSKEVQLNAEMHIQGNDEFNDPNLLYDGKTQIKGRGNSTWDADKKPYKLKLGSKADLFGMGKNKHWVLLSNPYDTSNMRNSISYGFADDIGVGNQKIVWVELVLNGKSVGIYQLCEHVRIGENRTDITNWDDIAESAAKAIYKKNTATMTKDERDELIEIMTDNMNWVTDDTVTYKGNTFKVSDYYDVPSYTGGYLLNIWSLARELNFITSRGTNVEISKPEGIGTGMLNYLKDYYTAFEDALFSDDYYTEYEGQTMRYTDFIDIDSFAKGVLVNELFENYEFGLNSTYMSKDIDGKLVYGPVWDMDYTTVTGFNSWTVTRRDWVKRLIGDPVFMEKLREQYFKYRYTDIQDVVKDGGDIDKAIEKIRISSVHNDKIWDNAIKFEENANDFKWRVQTKINWLDSKFKTVDSAIASIKNLNNKHAPLQMPLAIENDTLSVSFVTAPASVKVFANGTLYKEITAPEAELKLELAPADGTVMYTAIAYDEDGNVLYTNYMSTERYVKKLTAVVAPERSAFRVGEKLEASDFILTAEYINGVKATVTPELIYTYIKNSVGIQYFCQNQVTDRVGQVYAVLMYGNEKTEVPIPVLPRDNVNEVEMLISLIPDEYDDLQFFRTVFEAKAAYDALSDEAKASVRNAERLKEQLAVLDQEANSTNMNVLGCYIDRTLRRDLKANIIVVVKYSPRRVIFKHPSGGTVSYSKDLDKVLSVAGFGTESCYYELWTINNNFYVTDKPVGIYSTYNGMPASETRELQIGDIFADRDDITNVEVSNDVQLGEKTVFDIACNTNVQSIRLTEGETELTRVDTNANNNVKAETIIDSVGKHSVTVSYLKNGEWFDYGTYDTYVTEPVETGKIFYSEYVDSDYRKNTDVKVITDEGVDNVSAVIGETVTRLDCTVKNGYKLWTGKVPVEKETAIYADGAQIGEEFKVIRIGDVNVDGNINSKDALEVLRYSTEMVIPTEDQAFRADVNKDGKITSVDALKILQISTGIINAD